MSRTATGIGSTILVVGGIAASATQGVFNEPQIAGIVMPVANLLCLASNIWFGRR